jgi:hypothetical protein
MIWRLIWVAGFVLAFAVPVAFAHGWYPVECCSGHDCDELAANRVKALPQGAYLIDGRFTVQAKEVRQSPDGQYHACFPTPEYLRCFFAPPMGS